MEVTFGRRDGISSESSTSFMTSTTSSTKKSRGKEEIIVHPIFVQASQIATDPYWSGILLRMGHGKFHRGFSMRDGILYHRKGSRITTVDIPSDPTHVLSVVSDFMKKTAGFRSDLDHKKERQDMEEKLPHQKPLEECTWAEIKKRKLNNMVMEEFIRSLVEKYSLNRDEEKELITVINLGFLLGYFKPQSVKVERGKIVSIKGLQYNETSRRFTYDPTLTVKKSKKLPILTVEELYEPPPTRKKVSHLSKWRTFCDDMAVLEGFRIYKSRKEDRDECDETEMTLEETEATSLCSED